MPLHSYLASPFAHDSEFEIFERIHHELGNAFGPAEEDAWLIGNFLANGLDLDAVFLHPGGFGVLEMKNYKGQVEVSDNGPWRCDENYVKGGNQANPAIQVKNAKFALLSFSQDQARRVQQQIPPFPFRLAGYVVFRGPIQVNEQNLSPGLRNWLRVTDLDSVAERLHNDIQHAVSRMDEPALREVVRSFGFVDDQRYEPGKRDVNIPTKVPRPQRGVKVVDLRESRFRELFLELRNEGGPMQKAATAIQQFLGQARQGHPPDARILSEAVSSIPNGRVYRFPSEVSLLVYQDEHLLVPLFVGKEDAVLKWISENQTKRVIVDASTSEVSLLDTRSKENTLVYTQANTPFLQRLPRFNAEHWIPEKFMRKQMLAFDESTPEKDIQDALDCIENAEVRTLLEELFPLLRANELTKANRRLSLALGEADDVAEHPELVSNLLETGASSETAVVLNDLSEDEFKRHYAPERFADYLVWLHPDQRRVVDEDHEKPCILYGISGSGKTNVLVHRAVRLSRLYPKERILILTLNRALAELLQRYVEKLAGGPTENIVVRSFYQYLRDMLAHRGLQEFADHMARSRLLTENERIKLAEEPLENATSLFTLRSEHETLKAWRHFCEDEEEFAQLRSLIEYLEKESPSLDAVDYLYEETVLVRSAFRQGNQYLQYLGEGYERIGRQIQFQDKRRSETLDLLKKWEKTMLVERRLDDMALTQAIVDLMDRIKGVPIDYRYRCVLVDEFQDLSTLELEIVRRIPRGPNSRDRAENALFLCGDTSQKVYAKELSLTKAELTQSQRETRWVRKNYRNTRQILQSAHRLLECHGGPDLAKDDGIQVLAPEYAQREGPWPIAMQAEDELQAAWHQAVEWLNSGYSAFSVCIATADPDQYPVELILERCPHGVQAETLTGNHMLNPDQVVVSDIRSVKGFEFSLILIVGLGKGAFPRTGRHPQELWRDAYALYVAMTRGRDEVRLIYSGEPSPFIADLAPHVTLRTLVPPVVPVQVTETPALTTTTAPVNLEDPNTIHPEELVRTSLNGYDVLSFHMPVCWRKLSKLLGRPTTQVVLPLYEIGKHPAPDDPLDKHHIRHACAYFNCVPRFLN